VWPQNFLRVFREDVQEPPDFCVAPATRISYNRETRGLKFIAPLWVRSWC